MARKRSTIMPTITRGQPSRMSESVPSKSNSTARKGPRRTAGLMSSAGGNDMPNPGGETLGGSAILIRYHDTMSAFDTALILTGPTACGKTALALDLAERIGAEIVALDSMTVYRGMDIGTAKPTAAERRAFPITSSTSSTPGNRSRWRGGSSRRNEACRDITARGKRPLFVGGTPFYLKALLFGLFPGPPADAELRARLEAEAARRELRPSMLGSRRSIRKPPPGCTRTTCAGWSGLWKCTR